MRKEHRRVANTLGVERTELLEGSQTSPRRLKLREATSGRPLCSLAALWVGKQAAPRERLECGSSRAVVAAAWNRRDGQNIALGHSREPPATKR
jgi:hypothetical protein